MNATLSRAAAKHFLGTVLWPFPTRLVSRHLIGREQGLVLMFHYIGSPLLPGVGEDLFLAREEFVKVLDFVASRLCPLAPEDFLERLRAGTLPDGATLLTFDDCTAPTVEQALPELVARRLKACFFANPGLIDAGRSVPCLELMQLCAQASAGRHKARLGETVSFEIALEISGPTSRAAAYRLIWPKVIACPSRRHAALFVSLAEDLGVSPHVLENPPAEFRLASWEALERLYRAGMLVANHTPFHSTVAADGLAQFTSDVAASYDVVEARFPSPNRVFCYPYGRTLDATAETATLLKTLHTEYAFVTQGGIARAGRSGLLNLRREGAVYTAGSTKLAPLLAILREAGHSHAA
jgi:peptidoglycan/xylan/chitin deacetylase (PgdA/CDA1 family)